MFLITTFLLLMTDNLNNLLRVPLGYCWSHFLGNFFDKQNSLSYKYTIYKIAFLSTHPSMHYCYIFVACNILPIKILRYLIYIVCHFRFLRVTEMYLINNVQHQFFGHFEKLKNNNFKCFNIKQLETDFKYSTLKN
jgi:hypothetical protein